MIPSRASDAGPESLTRCQSCDANLKHHSTGACIACEGPCCDACGQHCDDGWWCTDCLERLIAAVLADMSADMRAVEIGAKL
jgi:hypothetical protein